MAEPAAHGRRTRVPLWGAGAALMLLFSLLLTGCSPAEASCDFFAMDTVMHFSASGSHAEQGLADAQAEVDRLNQLFSISVSGSDIARLNQSGSATVSPETSALLTRAHELSAQTDGAFDITIYPVVQLWGFYSGDQHVPAKEELSSALQLIGQDRYEINDTSVALQTGTQLDLGAIAKGYASYRAAKVMQDAGVQSANLSLGGNIHVVGTKPDGSDWTVAIADPTDTNTYAGTLQVQDTAVVTSGGYQRFFTENGKVYHHIIDPKTGYPADSGLLSVTIISQDDVLADALSTALFVMGEEEATAFWQNTELDFEMVLITEDNRILCSEGIRSVFTPAGDHQTEVIHR